MNDLNISREDRRKYLNEPLGFNGQTYSDDLLVGKYLATMATRVESPAHRMRGINMTWRRVNEMLGEVKTADPIHSLLSELQRSFQKEAIRVDLARRADRLRNIPFRDVVGDKVIIAGQKPWFVGSKPYTARQGGILTVAGLGAASLFLAAPYLGDPSLELIANGGGAVLTGFAMPFLRRELVYRSVDPDLFEKGIENTIDPKDELDEVKELKKALKRTKISQVARSAQLTSGRESIGRTLDLKREAIKVATDQVLASKAMDHFRGNPGEIGPDCFAVTIGLEEIIERRSWKPGSKVEEELKKLSLPND